MERICIEGEEHLLYPVFKALYETSFPLFEQRSAAQQQAAFGDKRYRLYGYVEQGVFLGFIACWVFDGYRYVEHFAVDTSLRGNGYGSRILADFIAESVAERVVLEIDPVVDELSAARLRFYRRCGFSEQCFAHVHPPYDRLRQGHGLTVLATGGEMTAEEYGRFADDLRRVVMAAC